MTRDDITRMARKAGLPIFDAAAVAHDPAEQAMADIVTKVWHDSAERFAALVAAAAKAEENEACARFVEEGYVRQFKNPWREDLAAAIRSRGNT